MIQMHRIQGKGLRGIVRFRTLFNVKLQENLSDFETFEKGSILFNVKEAENFNHRNILNISRIKI